MASYPEKTTADRDLDEIDRILSRIDALERELGPARGAPAARAPRANIGIGDIKAAVCRYYSVTAADLERRLRREPVLLARQVAMYVARQLTRKSLPAIARSFGHRNHATVLKACRRIERLRLVYAELDESLQALASQIRASAGPKPPDTSPTAAKRGEAQSAASDAQEPNQD